MVENSPRAKEGKGKGRSIVEREMGEPLRKIS